MKKGGRGGQLGLQQAHTDQKYSISSSIGSRQAERTATVSERREAFEPGSLTSNTGPKYETQQPSNSSTLVGTCTDMCPAKERAQRERLRDLAVFERLDGNPGKTSSSLAVKKFCRTLSSHELRPSDLRPPEVLQNTLKYLLSLMDSSEGSFEEVHEFVFDRTRSIRQDLSMQNITNEQAMQMYEEMTKFHIISHHKLARCCSGLDNSSLRYLNMEQLIKCLLSLYEIYDLNRRLQFISKNEMEFRSFYVLLHLGHKIPLMEQSLSLWFHHLAFPILRSKEMCFARALMRYFWMGNYKRFFVSVAGEASKLQLCLIEPFLNEVRVRAISCINHSGYKLQPYPLEHLCKLLLVKEQELESLCVECGLEIIIDELGCKILPTKQTSFHQPKGNLQSYCLSR
ncbi:hypothetical protein HPP92_013795 [Vanilla planifolia]|uniref:SAC3/GANP/THP3 conserved domain-containing protein n=1 Tax=Vanilla planifolia TaxID=51239 RepID=A0A835QSZ4_VANPL|nr:hypothetical protein HPP92_013795 [Vanilla planifolia]